MQADNHAKRTDCRTRDRQMAMTKTEAARLVAIGRLHETFAHDTLGSFDITTLRGLVKRLDRKRRIKTLRCRFDAVRVVEGINADPMEYLLSQREVDFARAALLTDRQLADPLIYLLCPPGSNGPQETHLLVDGIHRLYERKRRGYVDFAFYLIPLAYAPRIDRSQFFAELLWGEKDLIPGRGLVPRKVKT
jgi:hypothetical protein